MKRQTFKNKRQIPDKTKDDFVKNLRLKSTLEKKNESNAVNFED